MSGAEGLRAGLLGRLGSASRRRTPWPVPDSLRGFYTTVYLVGSTSGGSAHDVRAFVSESITHRFVEAARRVGPEGLAVSLALALLPDWGASIDLAELCERDRVDAEEALFGGTGPRALIEVDYWGREVLHDRAVASGIPMLHLGALPGQLPDGTNALVVRDGGDEPILAVPVHEMSG